MNKAEMTAYLQGAVKEYREQKEILLYAADPLPKPKNRYYGQKMVNQREESYQQFLEEIGYKP